MYATLKPSLRFYEALGFEQLGRLNFDTAYNVYVGLPGDGARLELTVNVGRSEAYDLGDGYNHLAVAVDDIDAALARVAAIGVAPEKPPYRPGEPGGPAADRVRRRPGRLPRRADRRRSVRDAAGRASPVGVTRAQAAPAGARMPRPCSRP